MVAGRPKFRLSLQPKVFQEAFRAYMHQIVLDCSQRCACHADISPELFSALRH